MTVSKQQIYADKRRKFAEVFFKLCKTYSYGNHYPSGVLAKKIVRVYNIYQFYINIDIQ